MIQFRDNCSRCGRFFRYETCDGGTPFGNSTMAEPPEPDFWCESCAKTEANEAVKSGFVPTYWLKPWWVHNAAKRLGLVECGPHGAAWSEYRREVPSDWERR